MVLVRNAHYRCMGHVEMESLSSGTARFPSAQAEDVPA